MIRTIDDILDFTKSNDYLGLLTTTDFEKAFDSLRWDFLIKSLKAFNFGPSFMAWIETFYKNVSSCVMNNGFSTPYFALKRGVRQGDPLSPYLFIISLETLAIQIRNNDDIHGIKIDKEEVKLTIFADDMTCFLSDKPSCEFLMNVLSHYSENSGLKVNREKLEIFCLGNMKLSEGELDVGEIKKVVKILGIRFTYNPTLLKKLNFDSIIKSVKKNLGNWNWRGLTLLGRIQIVKTFSIALRFFTVTRNYKQKSTKFFLILYGKEKIKLNALP